MHANDNVHVPAATVPLMQAVWALHTTNGASFRTQVLALTRGVSRPREGRAQPRPRIAA